MAKTNSEQKEVEMVMLLNGKPAPKPLVMSVNAAIEIMFQEKILAFWMLVFFCRRETTSIQGSCREYLIDAMILERDGSVHPSIRDIVLSSTTGEGLFIKYRNPIAGSHPEEK